VRAHIFKRKAIMQKKKGSADDLSRYVVTQSRGHDRTGQERRG
jgi:hypothetical protein